MATTADRLEREASLSARLAAAFPMLRDTADRIAAQGVRRGFEAGAVLFDWQSPCQGFPMLLSGEVRVVQRYANGRELLVYRVRPGDSCVLSGSCLMADARYEATGIAETDVEMIVLPAPAFHRLVAGDEAFRRHVFASFGTRLAEALHLVHAVANERLDQRLATVLLAQADGEDVVHATHQALANSVGSVREIVSRVLGTFEDRGWVDLGRERVRIVRREALDRFAGARPAA